MTKGKLVDYKGYADYINTYLIIDKVAYQFRMADKRFAYFGDWDNPIKISTIRYHRAVGTNFVYGNTYQTWYEKLGVTKFI